MTITMLIQCVDWCTIQRNSSISKFDDVLLFDWTFVGFLPYPLPIPAHRLLSNSGGQYRAQDAYGLQSAVYET